MEGLTKNPPEETPGRDASELEKSQMLADDAIHGTNCVCMDRAEETFAHIQGFLPKSFTKHDGTPDVSFEGHKYSTFPMDHHEFIESRPLYAASAAKGEEAFKRCSEH